MGAGTGGNFGNTKGGNTVLKNINSSLSKNPNNLSKQEWEEITPSSMTSKTSSRAFTDKDTGLKIRFDKEVNGKGGYVGKDYCHILNPNFTVKHNYYLDKFCHKWRVDFMTIKEFTKKYNLYGSLLEAITYDETNNRVTLSIDFCYWQQEDYEEGTNETGMIFIKFDNVSWLNYAPYQINSDKIVKVSSVDDEITLTVFNYIMNDNVDIIIKADRVEVIM